MPVERIFDRHEAFMRTSSPQMRKFYDTYPPKMMMHQRDKAGGRRQPSGVPPTGPPAYKFNFKTNSMYLIGGLGL